MAEHRLHLFRPQIHPKSAESGTPEHASALHQARQERELDQISGTSKPKTMSVPVKVLVPLLLRAAEQNNTWLDDFADDNVQIDADLHEVLMAFRSLPGRRAG